MRFRILGAVEVFDGSSWRAIGSAKQRALLASLLLNANQVVPAERLISDLWPDGPPASASGLLAGYVWRLRHALRDDGVLLTRAPGYQLAVPSGAMDVHYYETLVAQGRAASDLEEAVSAFTRALAVFRDVPYADVPLTPSVLAERARLEESQLSVVEARIGAEIKLDRHEALLPELKLLVSQFPLRERLHAHLMLVLYKCGHQADALGTYRDLRRLLVNELGIEPSKPLRDLQQRILQEDPSLLGPAPVRARPRTPPPRGLLIGRSREIAAVAGLLAAGQVCAVHGPVGVGKTALAAHAAFSVAAHFPVGVLHFSAAEALHSLPPGVLAVLDDVPDVGVVPAGVGVLVTSRGPVRGVPGRAHVHLGRLSGAAAAELLRAHVGDREGPAAEIARLCERLPLALRLAGDRLATRPDWSLADFAARLADPRRRLDLLSWQDTSVRDRLAGAWDGLATAERSALRLLGALDLPVVAADTIGALIGRSETEASLIAERLIDAGLLESVTIDRYRVPDLVRLFARERQEGDASAAISRVVEHYVALVDQRRSTADRRAWYRGELATLRSLGLHDRSDRLHRAVAHLLGGQQT
ncbi:AfsR/SARP family transcriptional regulator [Lentzea sp. NPDC042327]|uniref:AfsR/SARP family transcriptional regulator n=1 Tax=Lentzea sp. NPDC042327 TaxID=3154801 RepID=UPI0033EA3982